MQTTNIILILILSYLLICAVYVYKFRGKARYQSLTEYLRKGWCICAPINCFLYMFTKKKASKAILNHEDFPELQKIQNNWKVIKEEVDELYEKGYFSQTSSKDSKAYYDIGFRTFLKYGWSKFYVNWYGHTHNSAKNLCPKTAEILSSIPQVNGAMFSILPIGSKLTRHLDPIATSLRYHLSLTTPNSEDCFINVDTETYHWKDGEVFMFDETYLHYANNNSNQKRIILMCDIDRPTWGPGKVLNFILKQILRFSVVPNIEGDKEGLFNSIFSGLMPVMEKIRKLKETNLFLYKVIKHTVNLSLAVLLVISIKSGVNFIFSVF